MKHYYVLVLLFRPHCLIDPFLHWSLWYTLTYKAGVFLLLIFYVFFFFFSNCSEAIFCKAHHFTWGGSWPTSQGHCNLKAVPADVAQLQLLCPLGGVEALGQADGAEAEQLLPLWLVQSCRSHCTLCSSILLAWEVVKGKPVGLAAHHKSIGGVSW